MKIGIIGTGNMGKTLGRLWAARGHEIFFGSREAAHARELSAEIPHTQGGSQLEAAQFGDVLLIAVPWFAFVDVARIIQPLMRDKIVIDCINPLKSSGSLALGHKWSAGEEVANELFPAKVVKAFNHLHFAHLDQPLYDGVAADAYYCSDWDEAKAVAAQLAAELGFVPVDIGPMKHARYLEPLAALWLHMAFRIQHRTEFAFKLIER